MTTSTAPPSQGLRTPGHPLPGAIPATIPATMLAARIETSTGAFGLHEIPVPQPGPGQVLLKVDAAGVCLTDVHVLDGSLRAFTPDGGPGHHITLGHEIAGTVAALGPAVPGTWSPGDRVMPMSRQRCERCTGCLSMSGPCTGLRTLGMDIDGGWAQYVLCAHHALVAVPGDLPAEAASIVPDAVTVPFSALVRHGRLRAGEAVGLWGLGGLGAHGVQIARAAGAAPLVGFDPLPGARARALDLGADLALDPADPTAPAQVEALTGGRGLDLAVDFAGQGAARDQAQRLLGTKGRLVLAGVCSGAVAVSDFGRFHDRRQSVTAFLGYPITDLRRVAGMVELGRLDLSASVTEVFALEDAARAVDLLRSGTTSPVRYVLRP
ncbi:alcohol dehydrogenase catalytic domain-containing protein [Streptomyces sp. NBC_00091]|uniref:alcohol dehydrogenase catalytic domain-containing protein n=1 Tax=Streptomyces sp. NBC_00091 TaxID=2975648 RepID=UPI00225876E1|nr:alcohol dehydrogenase catalytic domain-containing protein [Streptomyces sp. NBC_00091]MCX5381599.1 alcohol dehydrogenase catalytic domain-containing protein [Streptomyces sp. NBC_00091]